MNSKRPPVLIPQIPPIPQPRRNPEQFQGLEDDELEGEEFDAGESEGAAPAPPTLNGNVVPFRRRRKGVKGNDR